MAIRDGESNGQIASRLTLKEQETITEDAVKNYVRSLLLRFGCQGRIQLVIRAIQLGIIPLGEHDGSITIGTDKVPGIRQARALDTMRSKPQRRWSTTEISYRLAIRKGQMHDVMESLVATGWAIRIEGVACAYYLLTEEGETAGLSAPAADSESS